MSTRLLTSCRRVALALGLAAAAATAADPTWVRAAGFDVWNYSRLEREVAEARAETTDLIAADGEVQNRIAAKESLISDLIEGRMTLAEVTARFVVLNASHPAYLSTIRAHYAGRSDLEKTARNVIDYAKARCTDPAVRARVVGRLEAEFAALS